MHHLLTYLEIIELKRRRISCRSVQMVTLELHRESHTLKDPPKPHTDWYVVVSSTTMSASPIEPLVPKVMAVDGLTFVNNLPRSQVVCHCFRQPDTNQ